jgi:Ca2+-binding RTX toxin-like protein
MLHGRRTTTGGLALAGVLLTGLLVSGVPLAPAATDTSRCGGATNEVDPVTGDPVDPTVVIIGVNAPTEGDDVIFGTNGADTINGLGGNDIVCGFDGSDTINGGSGNDQVFGGLGADRIHGNVGDDELNGEAGDDPLNGDEGDDRLFGGDGSDGLDGGQGNDTLFGETSNDTLAGGGGDDAIFGGDDADKLDGGDGNDTLTAEAGDDTLLGLAGDDQLFAGAGDDQLDGGDGPDEMSGEAGNDQIKGGDGDDALFGGPGSDTLVGGNGADALSGGDDVDLVDYSAVVGGITLDLATNDVKGSAGTDTVSGTENVTGTAFDDELTGDAGANTLTGGAGDDTIDGGNGNDTENGGDGNDTFAQAGELANGADVMSGGGGTLDTVDYTSRGNPVSVAFDGVANDGEANENDNVQPDVEGSNVRPTLAPIQATAPDLSAPSLSNFRSSGSRFSPNGDGRLDEFTVTGRFSEATVWTFEVLSGASAVYTDSGEGTSLKAAWNGLNADGRNVVSTTFRWRVTGKDAAGNPIAARAGTVTVDRSHPKVRSLSISRSRLSLGRHRSSTIRFAVGEAARVQVKIRRGSFLRKLGVGTLENADTVAVRWNGRTRSGKAAKPGRYLVEVGVRDLAGNLTVRKRHITVTS